VLGIVVMVLVVRVLYVFGPLGPDEAGYLLVARDWHLGGPNLYGHYWVDRPPGLIAIFKLASLSGWVQMARVLTLPFAALFVASAACAGREVGGARAAKWAAAVGAAVVTTPVAGAAGADGEIFAAPLVMLSVALTLSAVRRSGRVASCYAFAAGLAGASAVAMKQNFGDGVIFAVALLVVSLVQRRMSSAAAARVAVAGVAGGCVVLVGMLAYAGMSGVGVAEIWYDLFGFRNAAFDVITDHNMHAPMVRAVELVGLAMLSGLAAVLVTLAGTAWHCRFTGPPLAWAVGITLATEGAGILAGGSYWPHYLLQLAPMVALAAALWAHQSRWLSASGTWTVTSAVVCTVLFLVSGSQLHSHSAAASVGSAVRAASRPGDTATVLFGNADVQLDSRMWSPYPQLWTLPMRTLDPHLTALRHLLTSERAPTWLVVWRNVDPWNIDPHDRLRLEIATHYQLAAHVCGHELWLLDGVSRPRPTQPRC
jgi:hypothetical protein